MSWANVAGAAVGVIGGAMSSRSASRAGERQAQAAEQAANQQLQASREANELQASIYRQQLATGAPGLQGGQLALSALMSGMGLGAARAPQGAGASFAQGAAAPAGTFTNAQGQAVDANGNVVQDATYGLGNLNYGATQQELTAAASPFQGAFTEQFTPSDLTLDPSYKWRLEQGQANLNARRAAGGNRWGSQAMKDIADYGQGAASQEYAAANERFLKNKSLLFDRLSGIAGIGSAAGNAASAAGTNAAQAIGANTIGGASAAGNYLTSGAAARAAGTVGSTQAIVGGVNQGLNNYYTMRYLNGGAGGGSTSPSNAELERQYFPQ